MKKNYGLVAASTIAALLSSGQTFASVKIVDGHYCSNNCKGQSDCGGMGNNNGCHGQNDCKGQGWKDANNEKDCLKVGGKWAKVPSENSEQSSEPQTATPTQEKQELKAGQETKEAPAISGQANLKTEKKATGTKVHKKEKSVKSTPNQK